MMNHDPHFTLGALVGAALLGKSSAELHQAIGDAEVMASPSAAPYNQVLCKLAAAAFAVAGDTTSPAAILFQNLAETDEWHQGYNVFSDHVQSAMAKQAMVLPLLAATHDKLGGKMLRSLVAAGVLGGAGIGSLGFLLSRNARQASSENEETLQKVRAYKQLKRDIEEDMADSPVMASKQTARTRYDV